MTPAVRALEKAEVAFSLHQFDNNTDTDFGAHAAAALDLPLDRVFKTLVVAADNQLFVAIAPSSAQIRFKALATCAGVRRVTLADTDQAQRSSGYIRGAISPFAQKKTLPTFLDESALNHTTILVSGGRRGLEIEIAPRSLIDICQARVCDLISRQVSSQ